MRRGFVIYSPLLRDFVTIHETGHPAFYAHRRSAVRALRRMASYHEIHSRVLACEGVRSL